MHCLRSLYLYFAQDFLYANSVDHDQALPSGRLSRGLLCLHNSPKRVKRGSEETV